MRHIAPLAGETPDAVPEQDAVTLGRFLGKLPAGVTVLHDAGNGGAPLRWVEPSELGDPTPYLLDGEFVLTAGLPFLQPEAGGGRGGQGHPDTSRPQAPRTVDPALADEYVARLVAAGVAALGFGLEPYYDAVPDEVADACRRRGLTLVEVPASIPFAALGLEFSKLLESGNAQAFRQLAETNRHLMRAVLSARPEHELLAALTQKIPVWAALFGPDGKVRAKSGAVVELSTVQPLVRKLLAGSGPRVETEALPGHGQVLAVGHPLRSSKDATLGGLVLGTATPLTPAQNSVVSSVVGLLELLVRQRTSGSLAPSQLATAVLLHPESLAGGSTRQLNSLRDLLAQSVSGTRTGPLRVVQGVRLDGAVADGPVRELLQWRRLFDTKLVELTEFGFAAITRLRVDDQLVAEVERLGWGLVVGGTAELPGLPSAYRTTSALRPRVAATGRTVREEEQAWTVAGLLGGGAGNMLASRLLAPVVALEPERRDSQLGLLRSWLGANGNWDATAKDLGLHRNSVRRQVNALAALLDMDFNQAAVRAELWIALQFVDSASPPGT
ncbi:transcriptional regulator, CdaR [Pseudarthrobacter chlorophenolicus A6]|uniref:Transcriptional regulator, CdaR n=1 Tax=Pseudarthrobacter chlorophenolicus (strain ATCC 700700 / DSM 12829 / CIP 107037 / JCM 12360 / KCTC 9906 / NCIMB 13794 / A6) TaxID=452863 RepID=B8HEQ9_PSECP|nr:PucR family transcriptional regulator [Pseudarthrobacter chlorophenolicus]ACL39175.1 transcriptional regulator, CdaR [Pseudarthrobacter chlorophenolicus A6]SDR03248.1 PucR C-terminal helix-turn-helix domain-containing protein [Pseudarthrobacter chlorophenolicus]